MLDTCVMFSEKETAYIKTQRLARIATVSRALQPDVAPVIYDFDGTHFYVPGLDIERTLKFRNVQRNPRVAFAIDDVESVDPWVPRGIRIHGTADIVEHRWRFGSGRHIRITPVTKWTWGIEEPAIKDGKSNVKRSKGTSENSPPRR